eukprot:1197105-Amphidinium_carterae.1
MLPIHVGALCKSGATSSLGVHHVPPTARPQEPELFTSADLDAYWCVCVGCAGSTTQCQRYMPASPARAPTFSWSAEG